MPVSGVNTINVGVDHNHWQRLSNITVTAFPDGAQVGFAFRGDPKDIILTLEGATTVIYSFNGNTDHGELITSSDRSQVIFRRRPAIGMWFRVAGGSGTITVEAWASQ